MNKAIYSRAPYGFASGMLTVFALRASRVECGEQSYGEVRLLEAGGMPPAALFQFGTVWLNKAIVRLKYSGVVCY